MADVHSIPNRARQARPDAAILDVHRFVLEKIDYLHIGNVAVFSPFVEANLCEHLHWMLAANTSSRSYVVEDYRQGMTDKASAQSISIAGVAPDAPHMPFPRHQAMALKPYMCVVFLQGVNGEGKGAYAYVSVSGANLPGFFSHVHQFRALDVGDHGVLNLAGTDFNADVRNYFISGHNFAERSTNVTLMPAKGASRWSAF